MEWILQVYSQAGFVGQLNGLIAGMNALSDVLHVKGMHGIRDSLRLMQASAAYTVSVS